MARKRKSKKEDYSLDFLKEQQVSEDEDAGSRNEYGNVNDYRDNPDDDEDAYPQEVDEPEEPDFSLEDEDVSMDTYSAYLAEVLNHKILTREQEHELFEKFKNAATEEEKKKHQDEIVEHNMKLVFSVIKREFSRRATPRLGFQDLISEGTLGLMHAIKKFDPDKGTRFSTYASLWIRQYAQRAIASGGLAYRLPPPEYHRLMSILTAQNNFMNNNILKPSVEQLSAATGLTTQKIETLLRASQINLSLDAQISGDTHTGETETQEFGNFIPDPKTDIEDEVLNNLDNSVVKDYIQNGLNPIARKCLVLRYGLDGRGVREWKDVGAAVGKSEVWVQQVCNRCKQLIAYIVTHGTLPPTKEQLEQAALAEQKLNEEQQKEMDNNATGEADNANNETDATASDNTQIPAIGEEDEDSD